MSERTFFATSYVVADGTQTKFPFSFAGVNPAINSGVTPYIAPEDVHAVEMYVDADNNAVSIERALLIESPNVATVVGAPVAKGHTLKIYRRTELRYPLTDYRDLQSVSEYDLDLANRQAIFVAQEVSDRADSAISTDRNDNFDVAGRRVVNMADAVDPQDAVNLRQFRRAIRVPYTEAEVDALPGPEGRANMLLGFDENGVPKPMAAASGSASDLEVRLRASGGAGIVGAKMTNGSAGTVQAALAEQTAALAALVGKVNDGWQVVKNVNGLRAIKKTSGVTYVQTLGYYREGDGGGAMYFLLPDSTAPEQLGTIVVGNDGSRWQLNTHAALVNLRQYGAKAEEGFDNFNAFYNALRSGRRVYVPTGVYYTSPVEVPLHAMGCSLEGDGYAHYYDSRPTCIKPMKAQTHIFKMGNGCDNFTFSGIRLDGMLQANMCIDASYGAFLTLDNMGVYRSKVIGFKGRQGEGKFHKVFSSGHEGHNFEIYSDASVVDCAFSGGTKAVRLLAGGNRIVNTWINSASYTCLAIEPLDDATNHMNTSITNCYIGETYGGKITRPIISITGTAKNRVRYVQISNSFVVGADGQTPLRDNYGITVDWYSDVIISNVSMLGNVEHTDSNRLLVGLWANNGRGLVITGGAWEGIATNPIVLGTDCTRFTINGLSLSNYAGGGDAIGPYAAGIRIIDESNFGQIVNCSFVDSANSPHPTAVSGGKAGYVIFENNLLRYRNATVWAPTSGKPKGTYLRVGDKEMTVMGAPDGTWQEPVRVGSMWLWFDSLGRMRVKPTMPSGNEDGQQVGKY